MAKLTPDDFARALREGRGTALMHVQTYGLQGIETLLLKACLEEQAYDAQCEGHRASWLYRMFKHAPEYHFLQRRIIEELRRPSEESSVEQLCELASRMARDGDEEAGTALRSFVWSQDFRGSDSGPFELFGCHAMASLDGLPAVVEIARRYGRILLSDPQAFLDPLDEVVDGEDGYALACAELTGLAKADPAIAAYLQREQAEITQRLARDQEDPEEQAERLKCQREQAQQRFTIDQIITAAKKHDPAKGKFIQFGRWCDEEALRIVLDQLSVESDMEICLRLLWVFRKATPQYIPERLWALALHEDARIRDASLITLAHVDDPSVGEFGRKYFKSAGFSSDDAAAIELFTKHYQAGDEDLIMTRLRDLHPDEMDAHHIGNSILKFCENNNSTELADILTWLYCTNPCTICRRRAVEMLIATDSFSSELAEEWQFDANNAI